MLDTWGTLDGPNSPGDDVRATPQTRDRQCHPAVARETGAGPLGSATDPQLELRYRHAANWCGNLVATIGCVVLLGWLTGAATLTSVGPDWISRKVSTALGLVAAGAGLWLSGVDRGGCNWMHTTRLLCATVVIVLAGLTLAEYASGLDLGIDQMLAVDPPATALTPHPGRMAPVTALAFVCCGIALLMMGPNRSRRQMLPSILALPVIAISLIALIGYVFGATELYSLAGLVTAMAASTSVAFCLLGTGILFTNVAAGPLHILASPNFGGIMLRRMLPIVIALPIVVMWLLLVGPSAALLGSIAFSAASVAVVMIVATTIIQFWHAGYLDRLSVEQRRRDEHISQLNAELESQVLALQAANRELDGFAYSMSHVLRSPLRAMHGFSQMVLDNCGDTLGCEDQRRLRVVQSNAAEMSDLLDRIRAFLQLGLQEMTVGPIDMQQAVHAAIAQLEPEFAGRDLQFAVGELPSAEADPVMVRQIWLNLLDNAIKFTAGKTAAMIEVGARSDNKQTTYFVKDNGAGFDMRYVSKLFGVFQQLHDRSQFPGMGTGLAVVNRIVSRHGGRVWAEGEPGGGATIYFSLPATTVRAAAAA